VGREEVWGVRSCALDFTTKKERILVIKIYENELSGRRKETSYPVLENKTWNCVIFFKRGNCICPKILSGWLHTLLNYLKRFFCALVATQFTEKLIQMFKAD
jgi:hypothetical protein